MPLINVEVPRMRQTVFERAENLMELVRGEL
jgi:hypothetical protein